MDQRRRLVVREDDPAVRQWIRAQMLEDSRDHASWLVVPLRLFINVTFLGTLLQLQFGGLILKAALASAAGAGLVFALTWAVLDYLFGVDLNQTFTRALLLFLMIGGWYGWCILGAH